jgi:hypothetical protein
MITFARDDNFEVFRSVVMFVIQVLRFSEAEFQKLKRKSEAEL